MELHVNVNLYYNEKSYAEKSENLKIIEIDYDNSQYRKYLEKFLKTYKYLNQNISIISIQLKYEVCESRTNILEDYFNVLFLLNNYDEMFNSIDIEVLGLSSFVKIFFLHSSAITAFDILEQIIPKEFFIFINIRDEKTAQKQNQMTIKPDDNLSILGKLLQEFHLAKKERKIHRSQINIITIAYPKEIESSIMSIKDNIINFLLIINRKHNLFRYYFLKNNIEIELNYDLKKIKKAIDEYLNENQINKDASKPIFGLRNLSNTCFFNATIQALFHLRDFRSFFQLIEKNDSYLLNALTELVNEGFSGKKIIDPTNLHAIIKSWSQKYENYMQADSFDFLLRFLKKINEELKKYQMKNCEYFNQLFEIKLKKEYFCECGKNPIDLKDSEEKTSFINIGLEIERNSIIFEGHNGNVRKSLDIYFNNMFTNKNCNYCQRTIKARSKIIEIPKYFILKIESEAYFNLIKNVDKIDLTPYYYEKQKNIIILGNICSSVIFNGGYHGGHYYAIWCDEERKKIHVLNDSCVYLEKWSKMEEHRHSLIFYEVKKYDKYDV